MYSVEYSEVDRFIDDLNLYDIDSTIKNIEDDVLVLRKYKHHALRVLDHISKTEHKFESFDENLRGIKFYNDDSFVKIYKILNSDESISSGCIIEKNETFKLCLTTQVVNSLMSLIINNWLFALSQTQLNYINNKIIETIGESCYNLSGCPVDLKYEIFEEMERSDDFPSYFILFDIKVNSRYGFCLFGMEFLSDDISDDIILTILYP